MSPQTSGRPSCKTSSIDNVLELLLIGDQPYRPPHHVVDVQRFHQRGPFPGEIEQAADDLGRAGRLVDDQIEVLLIFLGHVRLLPQQMGEGQHAGERVIDFMGHAGSQAADRGQFLRPADLLPDGLRELHFPPGNGLGHGVDGLAQKPQFARRADPEPRRHIAGNHLSRHGHDPAHGPHHQHGNGVDRPRLTTVVTIIINRKCSRYSPSGSDERSLASKQTIARPR